MKDILLVTGWVAVIVVAILVINDHVHVFNFLGSTVVVAK